ncbi:MAG: hypothetical protein WC729_05685 [Sphingomonas sp.]|uniref:hypothetical protein n=1 Tax=Sphingomonas sp. TaxID=28214 RepID=UPI003569F7E0
MLVAATLLGSCHAGGPTTEEKIAALQRESDAACMCEVRTHGAARAECWRAFDAKISKLTDQAGSMNALWPTSPTFQCIDDKGACIEQWYSVDIARSPRMRVCSAADAKAIDEAYERVQKATGDVLAAEAAGLAVARQAPTLIIDEAAPKKVKSAQ